MYCLITQSIGVDIIMSVVLSEAVFHLYARNLRFLSCFFHAISVG